MNLSHEAKQYYSLRVKVCLPNIYLYIFFNRTGKKQNN